MKKLAVLIMAAGASRRLGQAKQLLSYKNSTLLNHTIQTCLDAQVGNVHIVLGANEVSIKPTIDQNKCTIHYNPDWPEGLASSIAFGVNQIDQKDLSGVIVVLADQLFLNKNIIHDLASLAQQGAQLVNCVYLEGSGPPSYFDRKYFYDLKMLKGDAGAKKIFQLHANDLKSISFPKGHIDIDKPGDLSYLV